MSNTDQLFDVPEQPQTGMIGPLRAALIKAQSDALESIAACQRVDDLGWDWSAVIFPVEELEGLHGDAACFEDEANSIDLAPDNWAHMSKPKRDAVKKALFHCRDSILHLAACLKALEDAERKQIQESLTP